MSSGKFKQVALDVPKELRREVRTQFGALCWRVRDDKVQILLVTSRGSGRWIIPKGWPIAGATPSEAAAVEAREEAGVEGRIGTECLGIYSYLKKGEDKGDDLPCVVAVFPLKVKRVLGDWPEKRERRRKWVSARKAALMVEEPELREIIRRFSPPSGRG